MKSSNEWFGHPRGLFTLFFTEMWERFSFYGMKAILILFMTSEVALDGMGLDIETAGAVFGMYAFAVYLLSLPGGWLADRVLGQQKAIWYGGILIMIGHLVLAIPGTPGIFYSGLGFISFGTGLLKPNISSIVGDLYPEGGARRDAGFSLFYMGINIGAILGPLLISFLGEKVNWHLGFGLAAVGMFFGLLQFRLSREYLGDIGKYPKAKDDYSTGNKSNIVQVLIVVLGLSAIIAVLITTGIIDLTTARGVARGFGFLTAVIVFLYFGYIIFFGGLDMEEKKKVAIIILLFLGAAIFWSGFEQTSSTLNLFAARFTDRSLFGFEIPAGWLQTINPVFIVVFAPIIGSLWVKLAAKNLNPNIPVKFAIGLVLLGAGFLMMYFAAGVVAAGNMAGMHWLVMTYFLHSIGELSLSPVGLSATTKLAPKKFYSQMMGIWFVGAALGNLVAGIYAGGLDPERLEEMPNLFLVVAQVVIGAGLVFLAMSPFVKKWVKNVR
jgi:proton-dependent oligopeptide transporter, POT family